MNYRLKIPLLWLMLLAFSMAQAQTDIFYESFDENSYTGGNDGQWSGSVASGGTVSTDNEGWTFDTAYGANQCIRLGSSKKAGIATTPALTLLHGDATLTFKAGSWGTDGTTLTLTLSGGGTLSQASFDLKNSEFDTYTTVITGGTPTTQIKFESASKKRFFLDEVHISGEVAPQKVEVSSITQLRQQESGTPVRLTLSEANQGNIEYVHNGATIDAYVRRSRRRRIPHHRRHPRVRTHPDLYRRLHPLPRLLADTHPHRSEQRSDTGTGHLPSRLHHDRGSECGGRGRATCGHRRRGKGALGQSLQHFLRVPS